MAIKIKLRTCNICGTKKKVAEFSSAKTCIKCEERMSTESVSSQESTDDETQTNDTKNHEIPKIKNHEIQPKIKNHIDDLSLHAKIDDLSQRLNRMEALMMGLMELVGKINYDMEINKMKE